jgi:hypothetical protein
MSFGSLGHNSRDNAIVSTCLPATCEIFYDPDPSFGSLHKVL